jgi:hypothetical protein
VGGFGEVPQQHGLVAVERAAGASWTTSGAAQDPPVSRQATQQRYQRLVRRADVTSGGDTVVEPTPEPARYEETNATSVNKCIDETSPCSGAWLVTIEDVTVGSIQPTYSGARASDGPP